MDTKNHQTAIAAQAYLLRRYESKKHELRIKRMLLEKRKSWCENPENWTTHNYNVVVADMKDLACKIHDLEQDIALFWKDKPFHKSE